MKYVLSLICVVVSLIMLTGCTVDGLTSSNSRNVSHFSSSASVSSNYDLNYSSIKRAQRSTDINGLGQRTKTSGCQVQGPLQDKACTPGAIFPDVTKDQICQLGYASSVRKAPTPVVNAVYAEYGIQNSSPGQYEVDHLVTLELGGSNDIANLWPEAASPRLGFHEKDQVENYLHDQVCSGAIPLHDAQIEIANNWLDVYRQMQQTASI